MRVTKNLTEGNIYKNFFFFAIPLIFASLLTQTYSVIDLAIAGKYIGDFAVGAIGATGSFDTMLMCFFAGFAVGFSIYIARLFGAKEYARLKGELVSCLIFLSAVILIVSGLCLLFCGQLFDFLQIDGDILEDASVYFIVCKVGYLPLVLNVCFVQILSALGITSYALYMSLLSALLNIGGNLLSVTVFDLGMLGIALSTVISALVVTLFYIYKLASAFRDMSKEKTHFRFRLSFLKHSLRYAGPASAQQLVMCLASLFIAPFVNILGPAATTGYAVCTRFHDICAQSYQNSSKALATYTAQSIGAGKYGGIRRGVCVGLLQGFVLLLPFLLFVTLFARPFASLFFPAGYTGDAYIYAVRFAQGFLPLIVINMLNNLGHSFFRGMGAMGALLISTLIGSASRLAATLLLIPTMQMDGVFLGFVIGWVAEAVFCLSLYFLRYRTEKQLVLRARS